jgi:hypothetical protein
MKTKELNEEMLRVAPSLEEFSGALVLAPNKTLWIMAGRRYSI